jgi:hypothetical protein
MIVCVEQDIELELPGNWRELPPTAVLASKSWICEWVEETSLSLEARVELVEGLAQAADFVLARGADDDHTWILILDPCTPSRVRGLAMIRSQDAADAALESNAAIFASAPLLLETASSWAGSTELATFGSYPSTVLHEFLRIDLPAGPVVTERYVGTVFPDRVVSALQLEIAGEGLQSFDDIVAVGNAVLGSIRVVDSY